MRAYKTHPHNILTLFRQRRTRFLPRDLRLSPSVSPAPYFLMYSSPCRLLPRIIRSLYLGAGSRRMRSGRWVAVFPLVRVAGVGSLVWGGPKGPWWMTSGLGSCGRAWRAGFNSKNSLQTLRAYLRYGSFERHLCFYYST